MKVIVVGAGPAGMMCAGVAAESGNQVILLEKNEKAGKKLYITGKGRANVTNMTDTLNFISNVVSNPKFLMSAINAFSPRDTADFYSKWGIPVKVERGNRVFPESDKSSDIIKAHLKHMNTSGVELRLNTEVKNIQFSEGRIKGVYLKDGSFITADAVVIATGGLSYPTTGSTGDGYRFAENSGHVVVETVPALVPINLKISRELEGLSLINVTASILNANGKKLYSEFGEMLFTDTGVSGPIILSLSSRINRIKGEKLFLSIDLKPALTAEQLDARFLRDFNENINKDLINSLGGLLPRSLISEFIYKCDIDPRAKIRDIDKPARSKMVRIMKDLRYEILSLDPIDKGIITAGGVSVKDINPKTMESKKVKGLFFIGEVLDLDALTGGFNIQIALSTGYIAAKAISSDEKYSN
jgi:predicted Rossmann fold flavoprotein